MTTSPARNDEVVCVILPTYRRPHTVGHAIASVLGQTHADLELHVVGDGCDRATEDVVATARDPRVRFHRFPKGPGFGYGNRNRVLRLQTAPFVAYMTDDDLWFPDHLERALAELRGRGLDIVAFRSVHVRFPDTLDPHFFAFDWRLGAFSDFLRNWFLGAVGCVHRASLFARHGYWNEGLARFGDREFYNRARTSGAASAYVDEVTVLRFYARHWDSRYERLAEPPQRRYVDRLRDPAWREEVRARARASPRPALAARWRQWLDFLGFGLHSGPKFLRFWHDLARSAGR